MKGSESLLWNNDRYLLQQFQNLQEVQALWTSRTLGVSSFADQFSGLSFCVVANLIHYDMVGELHGKVNPRRIKQNKIKYNKIQTLKDDYAYIIITPLVYMN